MFSKCEFLVRDSMLIFWEIPQDVPPNSEYSQELRLNDVDHCGIFVCLPHFLSPRTWPPNIELSLYQVPCSCQNLSCIATVLEELILWQSMPRWILSAAVYYGFQLDPYWCQKNLARLLSTLTEKYRKNVKRKLWDEKQNRTLFLEHPANVFFLL